MLPYPQRIDMHVHLVGTGRFGSGCWYPRHGRYRWLVPLLAWCFGIRDQGVLRGDFEGWYFTQLQRYLRQSSLDAIVLLALDRAYHADGTPMEDVDSFFVPNDLVLALASWHREFHAGVSIHPARTDAFDELERSLARGAALLKLVPSCQNIDLAAPRYRRFWQRLAEVGLPLLVHTGAEPALQELRPEWGRPRTLEAPLREGVTVIAAHCGGIYQDEFVEMLREFPNLYGDTAAFSSPFSARRLGPLLHPEVMCRLLHGSDLPVPVSALGAFLRGEISLRAAWRVARCANPLERDVRLKRMLGFPEEIFTRASHVLRARSAALPMRRATAS